jgi:hypothetical protein
MPKQVCVRRVVAARLQSTREGGRAAYASHTPSLF